MTLLIYLKPMHECPVMGLQPVMNGPPQKQRWIFCPWCTERLAEVSEPVELAESEAEEKQP